MPDKNTSRPYSQDKREKIVAAKCPIYIALKRQIGDPWVERVLRPAIWKTCRPRWMRKRTMDSAISSEHSRGELERRKAEISAREANLDDREKKLAEREQSVRAREESLLSEEQLAGEEGTEFLNRERERIQAVEEDLAAARREHNRRESELRQREAELSARESKARSEELKNAAAMETHLMAIDSSDQIPDDLLLMIKQAIDGSALHAPPLQGMTQAEVRREVIARRLAEAEQMKSSKPTNASAPAPLSLQEIGELYCKQLPAALRGQASVIAAIRVKGVKRAGAALTEILDVCDHHVRSVRALLRWAGLLQSEIPEQVATVQNEIAGYLAERLRPKKN